MLRARTDDSVDDPTDGRYGMHDHRAAISCRVCSYGPSAINLIERIPLVGPAQPRSVAAAAGDLSAAALGCRCPPSAASGRRDQHRRCRRAPTPTQYTASPKLLTPGRPSQPVFSVCVTKKTQIVPGKWITLCIGQKTLVWAHSLR